MKITALFLTFLLFACSPPPKTDDTSLLVEPSESTAVEEQISSVDACSLVLGFDAWEPYQYVDVGGVITGLDIELISGVAEQIGCEVSYQQGTWVDLLAALQSGEVDMLLGASKTPARQEFAYFSDSYRTEEFSLYIRKDDEVHANYASLMEFVNNGSKIGIVADYVYGEEVAQLLDDPEHSQLFVNAIMGEMNVARLLDEDVDVFLEDSFVGATMLRRKALSEFIMEHDLKIQTGNAYVMFSKQAMTEAQLATFNAELKRIKQSPVYTELLSKYSY
ncbi:substrate-binding periplasmic protein [Glaciecola sp. SC05]|uniref:substrate-binding periplasmic protein n=1 Tax=Glaciecola sp. SC05 TaxID=1987355 RepID=UPI003529B37F